MLRRYALRFLGRQDCGAAAAATLFAQVDIPDTVMTTSIGSGSSTFTYLTRILARLDTDGSGSVSKQEFVNGRPKDANQELPAKLFDALDSSGSGSMSLADLSTAFQQMSSIMQATMVQTQESAASGQGGGNVLGLGLGRGHGAPDPAQMFAALDANGDSSLTQQEFLAGKPDEVSTEQAKAMWSDIAGDNTDGLTRDQFVEAMTNSGPSRTPPDALNVEDGTVDNRLQQLMTVLDTYRSSMRASTNPTLAATSRVSA